jgi:Bacterial pre-peptidase C-terminal domain
MFAAGAAQAQTAGVVTLTANRTTSTGSFAPVLTWSTNPVAQSCTASGGWSGTKANYGTQTLATISASTNYTLTCTWSAGSANVTWTAPTTNVDGSALTNLARFKVVYGTSATALTNSKTVDDITSRSTTVSPLTPGTWYFAVRAVNTANAESSNSNVSSKAITGASAARTVGITINNTPPPTNPPPSSGNEVEPNNSTSQSQSISSSGTTVNGTMSASSDYDYYRVSLPAGKKLTAKMTPNSTSDYELYLYDSSGKAIAWSENGRGAVETVTVTNSGSSARTYYVRVNYYGGGTGSSSGKYSILLSW